MLRSMTTTDTITTEQEAGLKALATLHRQLRQATAKVETIRAEAHPDPKATSVKGARERKRAALAEVSRLKGEVAAATEELTSAGVPVLDIELAALTADQRKALGKLQRLHVQRSDRIEEWRSGVADYPALLELVVFRGVSTDDAGDSLGVSREAVAKRLRPVKAKYGLTGRGMTVRRQAEAAGLRRPFAKLTEDALVEKARAEIAKAAGDRDANLAKAAELGNEMATILVDLDAGKVPDRVMAQVLGVTPMTIYRFRTGRA